MSVSIPSGLSRWLAEHGDLFRSHLTIARWLDFWREAMSRPAITAEPVERQAGASYALTEVAAHLRQGDFLPGGVLYEEEVGRSRAD